jgi:uncharacterized protein (DUF1697 family)
MRYVAFLRAINVGGHTVRMEALRGHFESFGATNVETFIASGNVIFDTIRRNAAALERALEDHLETALGFPVGTFLRTIPELATVAAHTPFPESEFTKSTTLYVGFLKKEPDKAARAIVATLCNPVDDLIVHNREFFWLRRNHVGESLLTPARFGQAKLGDATVRNVTTVRKLAAKYCQDHGRR